MWTVIRIDEADYGCEERMPGEPLMALITLQSEDGRMEQIMKAEEWLQMQEIDEGDEWPEELDDISPGIAKAEFQQDFMDLYYESLDDLDGMSEEISKLNKPSNKPSNKP